MRLRLTKMQGAGNDFVMIDAVRQNVSLTAEFVRKIADRHFGVGADQVLVVETPTVPEVDFRYRIFNADGGEVEQCGNGARCFARFVLEEGLTSKKRLRVQTQKGVIEPEILKDGRVRVMMGAPSFIPESLPFISEGLAHQKQGKLTLWSVADETIAAVSMGNPTVVVFVDDLSQTDVAIRGKKLCHACVFPRQTNVAFLQVISPSEANIRVYERGAGETLACGSGTCSAIAAARLAGLVDASVLVHARGGDLTISWSGDNADPLYLVGDAQRVFDAEMDI